MALRKQLIENIFSASHYLKLPRFCDTLSRQRTKILMYHGIPAQKDFNGVTNYYGYNVPIDEFEQQIKYLKSSCNIISLRDFFSGAGLASNKTNIIITFDDGYENNYKCAFRVLECHKLPAVFALPTSFVFSNKALWNDVVEFAVNKCKMKQVDFSRNGSVKNFELNNFDDRLNLYSWLMRQCVEIDQIGRNTFINTALQTLEVADSFSEMFDNDDYRPLNKKQILEMAQSEFVEFASHSVNHYLLGKLDRDHKRVELEESKRQIEDITGTQCMTFCVPGGSYDAEMLDEAFDVGYGHVLTSDVGYANSDSRTLNRNGVFRSKNISRFADWIHGPVSAVAQQLRKFRN